MNSSWSDALGYVSSSTYTVSYQNSLVNFSLDEDGRGAEFMTRWYYFFIYFVISKHILCTWYHIVQVKNMCIRVR